MLCILWATSQMVPCKTSRDMTSRHVMWRKVSPQDQSAPALYFETGFLLSVLLQCTGGGCTGLLIILSDCILLYKIMYFSYPSITTTWYIYSYKVISCLYRWHYPILGTFETVLIRRMHVLYERKHRRQPLL